MTFSRLSDGQQSAVAFIVGAAASPKSSPMLKKKIADKNWHDIAVILSMQTSAATIPTEDDLRTVGDMTDGLRNANFMLMLAEKEPNADSKAKFRQALDTHCWDKVTNALQSAMAGKTNLPFSGADLHQAYAPDDQSGCQDPAGATSALGQVIGAGALVGGFFSSSLPDFFQNDFSNFFADSIPDFFSGTVLGGLEDFGDIMKDGLNQVGDGLQTGMEKTEEALNPTNW